MVKEERSLRTRQWPVRSGVLRGARSENLRAFDRPSAAQAIPDWVTESAACLRQKIKTEPRETSCPVIHGASQQMPTAPQPRTALDLPAGSLPAEVSSPATAVS